MKRTKTIKMEIVADAIIMMDPKTRQVFKHVFASQTTIYGKETQAQVQRRIHEPKLYWKHEGNAPRLRS